MRRVLAGRNASLRPRERLDGILFEARVNASGIRGMRSRSSVYRAASPATSSRTCIERGYHSVSPSSS
jgi:hypothetical protein